MIQVHAADIHANFSKEFITKCKGSSCFLPLPIGSSEVRGLGEGQAAIDSAIDSAETCKTSSSAVQDDLNETPSSFGCSISLRSFVQYQDQDFQNFCVPLSLASALHALGASNCRGQDLASLLFASAPRIAQAKKQLKAARNFMCEAGWEVVPLTRAEHFDPLVDKSKFPTLVLLQGTLHAITIVGNDIFDANEQFALPLDLHSLQRCAGFDHQYLGVACADRFRAGAKASRGSKRACELDQPRGIRASAS